MMGEVKKYYANKRIGEAGTARHFLKEMEN